MSDFKFFFVFMFAICFFFIACGKNNYIPVNSMSSAKTAIDNANHVKADRYAPEDIGAAEKLLYDSHASAAKEDMDTAKEQAKEAAKLAQKAYDTSLPLLANDTVKDAEKALREADAAAAAILARDEYRDAHLKFRQSRELLQNEEYYDSYTAALAAVEAAEKSKELSISRRGRLGKSIEEVRATIREADRYDAASRDPEAYSLAVEYLEKSEASYENLELKQGFAEVEVAKANADQLLMFALSKSAQERVAESSTILERAEQSDGYIYEVALNEYEAAARANQDAKDYLVDGRYREAIASADESIRLSTIVINTERPEITVAEASPEDETSIEETEEEKDYWIHTVRYRKEISKKDCLWDIAAEYYGNPRLWPRIYEANRDKIDNADLIMPGWKLKIPKPEKK